MKDLLDIAENITLQTYVKSHVITDKPKLYFFSKFWI